MLLTLQVKVILIAIVVAICAATVYKAIDNIHERGVLVGRAEIQKQYDEAKAQWETKLGEKQSAFDESISKLIETHNSEVAKLRQQNANFRRNPTVVNRYIPSTTQCTLPNGFVQLHNLAAQGLPAENQSVTAGDSSIKLDGAAGVIVENYYTCNEIRAQLSSLQEVVKRFQRAQKDINK